jgi:hypothetical protein
MSERNAFTLQVLEILLEWFFGFALVVVYARLAHNIALGDVREATSAGLPIILNSLAGLGGAWGAIIISRRKDRKANGNGNTGALISPEK